MVHMGPQLQIVEMEYLNLVTLATNRVKECSYFIYEIINLGLILLFFEDTMIWGHRKVIRVHTFLCTFAYIQTLQHNLTSQTSMIASGFELLEKVMGLSRVDGKLTHSSLESLAWKCRILQ